MTVDAYHALTFSFVSAKPLTALQNFTLQFIDHFREGQEWWHFQLGTVIVTSMSRRLPQGTSVLSPFFHIGSVITLAIMIYKKSASQLFEKHPCLYVLAFGFVSAKITNKLVVRKQMA